MTKEKVEDAKQSAQSEGLNIDKKTILSILAVLAVILVFVGILTQVVPRGEYQTDANGSIVDGTYTAIDDYRMPIWKIVA